MQPFVELRLSRAQLREVADFARDEGTTAERLVGQWIDEAMEIAERQAIADGEVEPGEIEAGGEWDEPESPVKLDRETRRCLRELVGGMIVAYRKVRHMQGRD